MQFVALQTLAFGVLLGQQIVAEDAGRWAVETSDDALNPVTTGP